MISNAHKGGSVKGDSDAEKEPISVEPGQPGKVSEKEEQAERRVYGGVSRERIAVVDGALRVVER